MINIISYKGNARQTTIRYHVTPTRRTNIKKMTLASVHDYVEKMEPSVIGGGNENDAAALENSLANALNAKHRVTTWVSNSSPKYIPEGIESMYSHKDWHA